MSRVRGAALELLGMHRRTLFLLPLAAATPAIAQAPLAVVASFSILGDLCRQVGGDRIATRVIAGPDTDAHDFQPRPSDAQAMRGAGLLVGNGLGFDAWFDRLARAAGPDLRRVTATDGIEPLGMEGHAHSHGSTERRRGHAVPPRRVADPHAWQDVRLVKRYVANIAAGLAAAAPADTARFQANAAAYTARLDALDAWVRAQLATVPEARRVAITAHDAFGYFAAAYGVRFVAPQGLSTAAEATAGEVGRLIRQIRAERITAVFVESAASPAVLAQIAQEAGVRISGRLFADSLSPPDGPAPTYEAMVRHNVGLLVPAMRGDS